MRMNPRQGGNSAARSVSDGPYEASYRNWIRQAPRLSDRSSFLPRGISLLAPWLPPWSTWLLAFLLPAYGAWNAARHLAAKSPHTLPAARHENNVLARALPESDSRKFL